MARREKKLEIEIDLLRAMTRREKKLETENDLLRAMIRALVFDLLDLKKVVKDNIRAIHKKTPEWKLRKVREELKKIVEE